MRILIFSTAYLPFVGGAELAIKEITERLPAVSFTLITARFKHALPAHERIGNVEVYRVGHGCRCDKWFLPFRALRLAMRLETYSNSQTIGTNSLTVGRRGFDVIWAVMASQASVAAAWFKKAFPDKKLVLTLQEGDEEEHLKRYVLGVDFLYRLLIRPWHLLVFKRADAITAISNYLAQRARNNAPNTTVEVIPNGVNAEAFSVERLAFSGREEIRHKLGIKPNDKVVITTSRLVQKNGIEDLVQSLRFLPEDVKMLICGDGPLESRLKLTAKRYTLNARVKFLGYVPHDELPPYLHAADIFCRPSLSEGMGSSFIEAMAAGLPVVATPVGGIPDFLVSPSSSAPARGGVSPSSATGWWEQDSERVTGLFCNVGDPRDVAAKIQLLLSNDELRKRIIENGSKMVREKYDWNGITHRISTALL